MRYQIAIFLHKYFSTRVVLLLFTLVALIPLLLLNTIAQAGVETDEIFFGTEDLNELKPLFASGRGGNLGNQYQEQIYRKLMNDRLLHDGSFKISYSYGYSNDKGGYEIQRLYATKRAYYPESESSQQIAFHIAPALLSNSAIEPVDLSEIFQAYESSFINEYSNQDSHNLTMNRDGRLTHTRIASKEISGFPNYHTTIKDEHFTLDHAQYMGSFGEEYIGVPTGDHLITIKKRDPDYYKSECDLLLELNRDKRVIETPRGTWLWAGDQHHVLLFDWWPSEAEPVPPGWDWSTEEELYPTNGDEVKLQVAFVDGGLAEGGGDLWSDMYEALFGLYIDSAEVTEDNLYERLSILGDMAAEKLTTLFRSGKAVLDSLEDQVLTADKNDLENAGIVSPEQLFEEVQSELEQKNISGDYHAHKARAGQVWGSMDLIRTRESNLFYYLAMRERGTKFPDSVINNLVKDIEQEKQRYIMLKEQSGLSELELKLAFNWYDIYVYGDHESIPQIAGSGSSANNYVIPVKPSDSDRQVIPVEEAAVEIVEPAEEQEIVESEGDLPPAPDEAPKQEQHFSVDISFAGSDYNDHSGNRGKEYPFAGSISVPGPGTLNLKISHRVTCKIGDGVKYIGHDLGYRTRGKVVLRWQSSEGSDSVSLGMPATYDFKWGTTSHTLDFSSAGSVSFSLSPSYSRASRRSDGGGMIPNSVGDEIMYYSSEAKIEATFTPGQ